MIKKLHLANVHISASITCVDTVRRATRLNRERKKYHCSKARAAVDAQDTLGLFAVLHGHHHVKWAEAIQKHYNKIASPPGTDPKKHN